MSNKIIKELPSYIKTIKVNIGTWISLKKLKQENETFDDVVKGLLNKRTSLIQRDNVKIIKYQRKVLFLQTDYKNKSIGLEFEYNDVKNQQKDFVLDLKIKKVFYSKRSLNPSIFFGLDSQHKHLSPIYLNLYLKCIALALQKEFRVNTGMSYDNCYEDIAKWKKIYYDYDLSEESFINDIEDPMGLSDEEILKDEYKKRIKNSLSNSIWGVF